MSVQEDLPMTLRAAYLALHRRSDVAFSQHGVTADQFVLLVTLSRGEALTQRELARRMPSDPSTVRAMLVLLEKEGLVDREPHPGDARARTVRLTAKGRKTLKRLWSVGQPIRDELFDAVGPRQAKVLVELLAKVAQALNPELPSVPRESSPRV